MIKVNDFIVLRKDRKSLDGGVCANIKFSLDTKPFKIDGKYDSLELIAFDIIDLLITYRLTVYYRPPIDDLSNLNLVISAISSLPCDDVSLVLTGDFNSPNIDWSNFTCLAGCGLIHECFLEFIKTLALNQHVVDATRGNNTLDLVFTSDPIAMLDCKVCDHLTLSGQVIIVQLTFNCIFLTLFLQGMTYTQLMIIKMPIGTLLIII